MRFLGILVGLIVVFLAGAYVDHAYDWPFGLLDAFTAPLPATASTGTGNTTVPRYSNARGAEDAPRNDVAQGATTDLQRCYNTMTMRGLKPAEAKDTCQKIISGISR